MKNRAFYSEPLDFLPGRLHITEDRTYVEIVATIDGRRCFKTFDKSLFLSVVAFLRTTDYFRGNDELLDNAKIEMIRLERRVDALQDILFNSEHSKYGKRKVENPEPELKTQDEAPEPETEVKVENPKTEPEFTAEMPIDPIADDEANDEEVIIEDLPEEISPVEEKNREIGYVLSALMAKDLPFEEETPEEKPEEKRVFEFVPVVKEKPVPTPKSGNERLAVLDTIPVPDSLKKYVNTIIDLKPSADGSISAQDKAVMILTIISLFEEDKRMKNRFICNDSFIKNYALKYHIYMHRDLKNVRQETLDIFQSMADMSLWEKVKNVYTPSGSINDIYELDSELAGALRQMKNRKVIKKVLYHTYFAG